MIIQKIPIIPALTAAGYPATRIRREKLIGQHDLQRLRHGHIPTHGLLDTLCRLLHCQPGDLIAYIPDDAPTADQAAPPADDPPR